MYGCEIWTVQKAECWRTDAFELWCWRRALKVPWTARRSNQSILKEISPGCSLEGLMLKLKLQYFGHLMWRADSLEKTLMLGGIGGRRRRGQQRMRWLERASPTWWTWIWLNSGSCWWTGRLGMLRFMGSQRVGHNWATELMVGLMVTSSKRAYAIPRSVEPRAPTPEAVHCLLGPPQKTIRYSSGSVSMGSLGPDEHKVCLSPPRVSGGYGVWS